MKLPKELAHLKRYEKYAKEIKPGVIGFFIDQFKEDGSKNIDWYEFRKNTIGASEIATLLGLDEYGVKAKMFWQKLGREFSPIQSKFTYWGLANEKNVADAWRRYDGTEDGYIDNTYNGVFVRDYKEIPCYAINIKYPWLSASLDFEVPAGQVSPFTGEVIDEDFPLEIKTISSFAAEKYELGLPTRYVVQVHQQMLVFESSYAEIAFLTAGTDFNVMPFHQNDSITNRIIKLSRDFWDIVEQGRPLYDEMCMLHPKKGADGHFDLSDEQTAKWMEYNEAIDNLEPEPEHLKTYEEFWKEKYKETNELLKREGTDAEFQLCVEYDQASKQEAEIKKIKQGLKNQILHFLKDHEEVNFGAYGRVMNRVHEGKRSYFKVNIKNYE